MRCGGGRRVRSWRSLLWRWLFLLLSVSLNAQQAYTAITDGNINIDRQVAFGAILLLHLQQQPMVRAQQGFAPRRAFQEDAGSSSSSSSMGSSRKFEGAVGLERSTNRGYGEYALQRELCMPYLVFFLFLFFFWLIFFIAASSPLCKIILQAA